MGTKNFSSSPPLFTEHGGSGDKKGENILAPKASQAVENPQISKSQHVPQAIILAKYRDYALELESRQMIDLQTFNGIYYSPNRYGIPREYLGVLTQKVYELEAIRLEEKAAEKALKAQKAEAARLERERQDHERVDQEREWAQKTKKLNDLAYAIDSSLPDYEDLLDKLFANPEVPIDIQNAILHVPEHQSQENIVAYVVAVQKAQKLIAEKSGQDPGAALKRA
jgi:hypothetical protein